MRAVGEVSTHLRGRVEVCSSSSLPAKVPRLPVSSQPWLEDPRFASRFDWLSTVAGIDLAHYGTKADAETIRETQIAQPLLVATGLVAALEVFPHPADVFDQIGAVAGHSVGEIAAVTGARVITAEQAMVLVRERGKAMARAAGHHADRHDRRPRRRPRRGPRGDRQARPDRRQRQRPRPDRRRRHARAARRLRRRAARRRPG